jgi:YD repeat-containing protein
MFRPSRNSHVDCCASWARGHTWRGLVVLLFILPGFQIPLSARASDQYEYDAAGHLFRVTHHTGRITTYSYDDNGRVLAIVVNLGPTAVEGEESPPLAFSLSRARPNPGSTTRFTFTLPRSAPVTVRLFDITGRLVATVVEGEFGPGPHRVDLSPGRWAAGVYYYRLDTPGFSKVQKFVHLK